MGKWLCKVCKCEDFDEKSEVIKSNVIYNKEGDLVEFDESDEMEFVSICRNCGMDTYGKGSSIKNIADWVEED